MAHYRKIATSISLDKKFHQLSREAKLIFYHLLSHMHLTALGAMYITKEGLIRELDFTPEEFQSAFSALCRQDMVRYDDTICLLWLPNFLKYNAPESPNAVRGWEHVLGYLPECGLRDELVQHAAEFVKTLSPSFQEALPDRFRQAPAFTQLPDKITEQHLKNNSQEGLPQDLAKVLPKTSGRVDEGLREGSSIQATFSNNEQILTDSEIININNKNNIYINNINNINNKLEILQETRSEEIINIGEIKNIVAPKNARRKTLKLPDAKVSEIAQVFSYWQQTLKHPQAQLDPKRRKVIKNALASGYSVAQLQNAIRGCSLTPHNIGENEQGQRYDGLHVILRDADQIDRFIRNSHSPPRRRTKADQLLADNLAAGERWAARFQPPEEKIINAID